MADHRNSNANDDFTEKLVAVNRVAKVVKGGRQFGFTALTVVAMAMARSVLVTARRVKYRSRFKKRWKKRAPI